VMLNRGLGIWCETLSIKLPRTSVQRWNTWGSKTVCSMLFHIWRLESNIMYYTKCLFCSVPTDTLIMHTTIWVVWVVAANLSYEIYSAVTVLLQNMQKTACSRPCCVVKLATKQSEDIIAKIKFYVILSFPVCV
jgi:hypothetical protein